MGAVCWTLPNWHLLPLLQAILRWRIFGQYAVSGPPRRGLPQILIPTTAGTGSEISPVAVFVDTDNIKKAIRHEYTLGNIAIVDPLMTQYLPPEITAQTGIDALTHAFEGYLCPTPNIVADMIAEMAIKLISENLRPAYDDGAHNLDARYNMAIAATYAMSTLFISGLSIYHPMGHSLQIEARTTHGISLYLVMAPIMEFNLTTTPNRFARIAELMGEKNRGSTSTRSRPEVNQCCKTAWNRHRITTKTAGYWSKERPDPEVC